jgi:hypothetical protein
MTRCRAGLAVVAAVVASVLPAGTALLTSGPAAAAVAAPGSGAAPVAPLRAGTAPLHAGTAPLHAGTAPLRVDTASLPAGIRGLYYLTALSAAGGTAPYTWSAVRLPAGLRLSPGGLLTGYPLSVGTQDAPVRVRDARGRIALATLALAVPASLPADCVARSCALLAADPRTVTVPARAIVSVTGPATRGQAEGGQAAGQTAAGQAAGQTAAGQAGQVVLRGGPAVMAGDVLALAAAPPVPSGLVAVAESVTARNGETVVAVRTATPAGAFYQGTVQAVGPPGGSAATVTWPRSRPVPGPVAAARDHPPTISAEAAARASVSTKTVSTKTVSTRTVTATPARGLRRTPATSAALSCADGVTSQVHGLDVTPSMTPTVAAQWRQNRYGLPARYAAASRETPGGLRLFQFTLAGTITVNMGVSVSGPARCTMTLPAVQRTVAAGGLGAVVLRLRPTLSLVTSGELDVATSVTLTCDAAYRLYAGTVTRTDHCSAAHQPLRISSLGAASATVAGAITVGASLDGLNVVTGTASAALQAGYKPGGAPAAETDARSDFDLTSPLGLLWSGAPGAVVTDGTAFSAVLSTSARRPPRATGPSVLTAVPGVAYPWSAAVCGYGAPTFGRADFTVAGSGFLPGERAGVSTGWASYPPSVTAGPGGSFALTRPVGEVPGVLDRDFDVAARGTAGSSGAATITLDADGCLMQSGSGGRRTVRWGGNGFDAASAVTLSVDGTVVSSAETDARGSGGAATDVSCPATGRYQWQVSGTVTGAPAAAAGWLSCAPHRVSAVYPGPAGRMAYPPPGSRQLTGAPAASTPVRKPWRVPPAGPPVT